MPSLSMRVTTCSRFESLILSHHSGFSVTCECNEEEINDDDDDVTTCVGRGGQGFRHCTRKLLSSYTKILGDV